MKKLISLLVAVMLVLSLMPSAFAMESVDNKFTDVPSDAWYLDELNYAVANGYISGTSATTFSPSGNITRGQFVTILGRMLGAPTTGNSHKFKDVVAGSWYEPYVAWAASMGYVNGTSATTFAPESNITFEQMAVILENYLTKSGVAISEAQSTFSYKDLSSVSTWARSGVDAARLYGLIKPDANGNLNPQKAVTRADGAVALVNLARAIGLGTEPEIDKPADDEYWESIWEFTAESKAMVQTVHDDLRRDGKITATSSEKDKAIAYYMWMCQNCKYKDEDYAIRDGYTGGAVHDAYGPLVLGYGVCEGLTNAYNMLLKSEGIECELVFYSQHGWTEAILDGERYKIDVTEGVGESWDYDGSYDAEFAQRMCDKQFMSEGDWWNKWYGQYEPLEW